MVKSGTMRIALWITIVLSLLTATRAEAAIEIEDARSVTWKYPLQSSTQDPFVNTIAEYLTYLEGLPNPEVIQIIAYLKGNGSLRITEAPIRACGFRSAEDVKDFDRGVPVQSLLVKFALDWNAEMLTSEKCNDIPPAGLIHELSHAFRIMSGAYERSTTRYLCGSSLDTKAPVSPTVTATLPTGTACIEFDHWVAMRSENRVRRLAATSQFPTANSPSQPALRTQYSGHLPAPPVATED